MHHLMQLIASRSSQRIPPTSLSLFLPVAPASVSVTVFTLAQSTHALHRAQCVRGPTTVWAVSFVTFGAMLGHVDENAEIMSTANQEVAQQLIHARLEAPWSGILAISHEIMVSRWSVLKVCCLKVMNSSAKNQRLHQSANVLGASKHRIATRWVSNRQPWPQTLRRSLYH